MIDENVKWAATFQEYESERIMVQAYIQAEARARQLLHQRDCSHWNSGSCGWNDYDKNPNCNKTLIEYEAEVEAELSK